MSNRLEGERCWFSTLRTHILACVPSADRFFATAVGSEYENQNQKSSQKFSNMIVWHALPSI